MFRANAVVRTVFVKELQVETKQGENGSYESKSIIFRVATDRNYTRKVMKDGKVEAERPTDFALCRANGALAEVIANNCCTEHSRRLYIDGHFEMYKSNRVFKVENLPVGINGTNYNLNFDLPQEVDSLIFVVDELDFLDKKPEAMTQAQAGATVANVSVTPATAPVVTVGTPAQQPVQQATQTAPQQAVVTVGTPVQTGNPIQGAMNTPVVPDGFNENGEKAPF